MVDRQTDRQISQLNKNSKENKWISVFGTLKREKWLVNFTSRMVVCSMYSVTRKKFLLKQAKSIRKYFCIMEISVYKQYKRKLNAVGMAHLKYVCSKRRWERMKNE